MLTDGEVFVHLVDFPTCACGGVVIANEDGTNTVLLNARLTAEQNRESYQHELKHIKKDDLYRCETVQVIEREAV